MNRQHRSAREPGHSARLHNAAIVLAAGTNGLGVVRSLRLRGIDSIVICKSKLEPAYLSRLPIRKILIPRNQPLPSWFRHVVPQLMQHADCVIPTSDEFASLLWQVSSESPDMPPSILPPGNLVDVLNDKKMEVELIRKLQIPLPATLLDLQLSGTTECPLRFPIIIKPRSYLGLQVLKAKNRIVREQGEWNAFRIEFFDNLDSFIAQEIIPGDERCLWVCNATFDGNSKMVSAFTFQRLGTVPYLYGVTTFAVSRHNEDVKALCERVGKALSYRGPVMFEFKLDPRSGEYCYIEINPRLGMCNWFDASCTVNNAFNTYALSTGTAPDINVEYQEDGVTYLNFLLDVYARIRGRQPIHDIYALYRRNVPRQIVFAAWYWRDPLPVLAHPLQVISRLLEKIWQRPNVS